MRIIGGKFRSRKLTLPPEKLTRPTTDRVRESLFSILESRIDFAGIRVLDGFSGSGALGLEALSRGAVHVTFMEQNPAVFSVLRTNIELIAVAETYQLIKNDLLKIINITDQFDLIFLDPPYFAGIYEKALEHIVANNWLALGGLLVLEMPISLDVSLPDCFKVQLERSYGQTKLLLLSWD